MEEEVDLKYTKRERKSGRSRAEKALIGAKAQSAPASPARSEKHLLSGQPSFLPF